MGKIGIYLSTGPEHENCFTVTRLAQESLSRGVEVDIFLIADGIYNCFKDDFTALLDKGAHITICEQSAKDRGVRVEAPVTKGSLYDLAIITGEVDRFLSFT